MRAAVVVGLSGLLLSACGLGTDSSSLGKEGETAALETFEGPVPRASCGAGSHPETDVQGRVPIEDRESGRSMQPYTCNTELVGTVGSGASWQHAWFDDCAYYGTSFQGGNSEGVQVVDASDSANPKITMALTSLAMLDPWESLKVNEKRGLLGAVAAYSGLDTPATFDVYDLTGDCSRPRMLASVPAGNLGHEGNWAPDGRTYYSAALFAAEIDVIDTTDPFMPKMITQIPRVTHGLDVSDDGNRLYFAAYIGTNPTGETTNGNGLEIYDSTLLNQRLPAESARTPAQPILLGSVYWPDGGAAQHPIPVTIQGKKYVIFVDEGSNGMARIIDINDEAHPFVVSKLKLEIDMDTPEMADLRSADATNGVGSFQYNGHYCGVPQRDEPGVVACSYFWSGVRVFDIRDPYHPREIAYYNPGGRAEVGPQSQNGAVPTNAGYASAQVRFVKERGEIWFTDQSWGFMAVKLTNGVWPFND